MTRKNNVVPHDDRFQELDIAKTNALASKKSKLLKKWEKIFDQEWAEGSSAGGESIKIIEEQIKNWLAYTPPSRRAILLNNVLLRAKDPKTFYECLTLHRRLLGEDIWGDQQKSLLRKEWAETSQNFIDIRVSKKDEELIIISESAILLSNSAYFLEPTWAEAALQKASQMIDWESDDETVKKCFDAIVTPGDLLPIAYRRFLETANNIAEMDEIVDKLSLANRNIPYELSHTPVPDQKRWEKANSLAKAMVEDYFRWADTLSTALGILENFSKPENYLEILDSIEACNHLARLVYDLKKAVEDSADWVVKHSEAWIAEYEALKKVCQIVISTYGRNNLLRSVPIISLASELFINKINKFTPSEELGELFPLANQEARLMITDIHVKHLKTAWDNRPTDKKDPLENAKKGLKK